MPWSGDASRSCARENSLFTTYPPESGFLSRKLPARFDHASNSEALVLEKTFLSKCHTEVAEDARVVGLGLAQLRQRERSLVTKYLPESVFFVK